MELAIFIFKVVNEGSYLNYAYIGYLNKIPDVEGELVKIIEVPNSMKLENLINVDISTCTETKLAPYMEK